MKTHSGFCLGCGRDVRVVCEHDGYRNPCGDGTPIPAICRDCEALPEAKRLRETCERIIREN